MTQFLVYLIIRSRVHTYCIYIHMNTLQSYFLLIMNLRLSYWVWIIPKRLWLLITSLSQLSLFDINNPVLDVHGYFSLYWIWYISFFLSFFLSFEIETINASEREGNINSAVNISQNSQPASEEHQIDSITYPISKKSKKSITENKSVMGSQSNVSQKQSPDNDKIQTETELVNNSSLSNINDFSSPRKTRWDQYNQIRLNKASIQNLQKSLDEQDILRQAFLAQYKPKACDSSRASSENWATYSRANSKDRTGKKNLNLEI